MSRTPITDALADWTSEVTGRVPVFDNVHRMGPRPDRRSCSMVLAQLPIGFGEAEITEIDPQPAAPTPNLLETGISRATLFISMNLMGGDTLLDMGLLASSMNLSKYIEELGVAGLGFARVGEARDLSDIVKHESEARHQADWEFNVVNTHAIEIPSIDSVTITNDGNGHSTIIVEV